MKYGETYYWFGEHKADTTSSAMVGVMCYASEDLINWRNCGVALSVSDEKGNDIERGCILERPKVIYNKVTKSSACGSIWNSKDSVIVQPDMEWL